MTTLILAAWIVAAYYSARAGGIWGIYYALRSPDVPRRWKVVLAICAMPVPGPIDEVVAAAVLSRIAKTRREASR